MTTSTAYDAAGRAAQVSVNNTHAYGARLMGPAAAEGLIGYWPLDERGGTTAADKRSGLTGSLVGGTRLAQGGGIDEGRTAFAFDGATGYVNVPDAAALDLASTVSIEYWARSDTRLDSSLPASSWLGGVSKANTYGLGWTTYANGGGWQFKITAGGIAYAVSSAAMTVDPDRWYHLAGTYDGTWLRLYVDGDEVASANVGARSLDNTANALQIGNMGAVWDGAIDEVSLYNAALSPSAVTGHFEAGRRPDDSSSLASRTFHDELGRVRATSNPAQVITRYGLDRLGRVTDTYLNYQNGAVSALTASDDVRSRFAYDALGELTAYCPAKAVFGSDACDPASTATGSAAYQSAYHYGYDAMARRTSTVAPVNATATGLFTSTSTYDAAGNLVTTCDFPAGGSCSSTAPARHAEHAYDKLGRLLSSSTYSGAGTGSLRLASSSTYSADGLLLSQSFDGTGSGQGSDALSFTYDDLGRLDQVKRGAAVLTDHDWADDDTLAGRSDGTNSAEFAYDWARRLTAVENAALSQSLDPTFEYRLDGLLASRSWDGSGTLEFAYDAAKRPIEAARADDSLVLSQTFDRRGNVASEARSFDGVTGDPGTGTQTFSYDPLDRLIESELGSDLRSYSYDLDGNRLTRDEGGVLTSYSYDRSDALIEQTIGTTVSAFAYDGFGNLTGAGTAASGTTAYAYDLGDRLIGLTPPGSTQTTFSYDALGRIATRSVPGAGTDTYSYVGLSEDAWQVDDGSTVTSSLVGPDGSRLGVLSGSTLAWTIPDLHGSLVATTDTADALSSALRYDGYGQTTSSWTASGPLPSPWRYQGRLELSPDAANPLYENGARSYSPGLGAFTQLDSYTGAAQDPLSMNRYLYAEANPATLIDPSGHYAQRGPDSDLADSQLAAGTGGGQVAPVYQAPPPPPSSRGIGGGTWGGGTDGRSAYVPSGPVMPGAPHLLEGTDSASLRVPTSDHAQFDTALDYMYEQMHNNAASDFVANLRQWDRLPFSLGPRDGELAMVIGANLLPFYDKVRAGGEWDHKDRLYRMLDLADNGIYVPVAGNEKLALRYDIWSNIHYGYVGSAAGYSPEVLQIAHNLNLAVLATGAGGDPVDDLSVQIGIQLWDRYGDSMTSGQLHWAILSHLPAYAAIRTPEYPATIAIR